MIWTLTEPLRLRFLRTNTPYYCGWDTQIAIPSLKISALFYGSELAAEVRKDVPRMIESLKRRGFKEGGLAPPSSSPLEITSGSPLPEFPPLSNEPGTWIVMLASVPEEKKLPVILTLQKLSGKDLAKAKELAESAPCVVGEGLSGADSRTWFEALTAAGASGSRYDAGGAAP